TMTVSGLVMVLGWDSAFPDRTDVLVLTPLPVRLRTLFLAKTAALFAAPTLAMVAFNLPSGIVWPIIFSLGKSGGVLGMPRTLLAYWATAILAGAFLVFTILAVQGIAATLLPRQIFLRLSALLQAAVLCLLLVVYFLEPSLSSPAALVSAANQRALHWLPSYWFLGLFHQLAGSMHPALAPLARRAWIGLGISMLAASIALLLSYFRMLPRIVEQPEIVPISRPIVRWPRMGSSLSNAILFFSARTLLRSRQHRMILSFYLGVGLVIVFGFIHFLFADSMSAPAGISAAYLLASVVVMSLMVLAMRVVASIPIAFRAHWIFHVTRVQPTWRYHSAVRLAWCAMGIAPMLLVLAAGLFFYSRQQTLLHLAAMFLFGWFLVEVCLFGFQKIPFTCSYLPGKGNLHFVFWFTLALIVWVLKEAAVAEQRLLAHRSHALLLLLSLAAATQAMYLVNRSRQRSLPELIFDEKEPPTLISLKLT
ncbi:MAG TPA: hypothetical protein VGG95_12680, partial [Edaphobacter sp.]